MVIKIKNLESFLLIISKYSMHLYFKMLCYVKKFLLVNRSLLLLACHYANFLLLNITDMELLLTIRSQKHTVQNLLHINSPIMIIRAFLSLGESIIIIIKVFKS